MAIRRFMGRRSMGRCTALGILCAAVSCVVLTGCGREDPVEAANRPHAVLDYVVSRVSGTAATEPDQFELLFLDDVVPNEKDRKIFVDKSFLVLPGNASMTGNTATAQVTVEDPNTGEEIGTIEWTFERMSEQDDWQIKTAPMP